MQTNSTTQKVQRTKPRQTKQEALQRGKQWTRNNDKRKIED